MVNVDFADVRTIMQNGGSALMGTGVGRGENRATEAAQQAIASPLLDNVSIAGASGVLINITGGQDVTLGEVTLITEMVHAAAGDDAEIIFGAVTEPAMSNEIRVTVIATGFDRLLPQGVLQPAASPMAAITGAMAAPVAPPASQPAPVAGATARGNPAVLPFPTGARSAAKPVQAPRPAVDGVPRPTRVPPMSVNQEVEDMEIPTFIRRQMD
jgi:cell division protein FtsZ